MIDLNEVGIQVSLKSGNQWQLRAGIYLPNITPQKGYQLKLRVIHEIDQFVRAIEPVEFDMNWVNDSQNDLWQTTADLQALPGTHFSEPGKHLYRFQLLRHKQPIVMWFADPFGRDAGQGTLSAFTLDANVASFNWDDASFKVPHVDDMVVYELHVGEFNQNFAGIEKQIDYLWDLGINVIEVMPFTNVKEDVEWGYTPLAYFAADERYGGSLGLKQLVNACHQKGIAVILDAVYAHAHPEFAYNIVYDASGEDNPMMGYFEGEFFSDHPGTDYRKQFTRDYFLALNKYWLDEFHLDGFRYDYVPGMYDGSVGQGYAFMTYHTYQYSKSIARFQDTVGHSRIIQCAEHLPDPQGVLRETYSNCCWQNSLMDKAVDSANDHYIDAQFAFLLDPEFIDYPAVYKNPDSTDEFPVAPFQYIESHDHARFITRIAPSGYKDLIGEDYGDRSQFYKIQPYIIALFTAKGIPMLWQGQEFAENWGMPGWGLGRNLYERPLHWQYFYDRYGKALIRLYRIMGNLRRNLRALSSRGVFYYYNDENYTRQDLVVFRRELAATNHQVDEQIMIVVNFSETSREVWLSFPAQGHWQEQIDKDELNAQPVIDVATNDEWHKLTVPSYYGCVYLKT
ncbi:MAG: hypothetical protein KAQ67_12690 [Gammaproteobacteria bacterium]|nr:hypothetical protein [Gammaproteobacteria bacterium]